MRYKNKRYNGETKRKEELNMMILEIVKWVLVGMLLTRMFDDTIDLIKEFKRIRAEKKENKAL